MYANFSGVITNIFLVTDSNVANSISLGSGISENSVIAIFSSNSKNFSISNIISLHNALNGATTITMDVLLDKNADCIARETDVVFPELVGI